MAVEAHFERTIRSEIEFSGIGLHSGAPVKMRLVPAPAGSGIVFRRTDLDGYEIPATGRNVAKVSYATSLMRGGVLISTTEHLLSAFIGYGVDNVIVEVDNLEVPILDGSALPYVRAFQQVGLKTQRRKREYIKILKEVEVRDGTKFIGVYPNQEGCCGYRIRYAIDFPTPIGQEIFSGDLATGDYGELIAPARTFGFKEDEAMLRNMGLIRGASPECAIILSKQRVENGPLRFPDEFVRHKALDAVGDLYVLGMPLLGRFEGRKAGHGLNNAVVRALLARPSAYRVVTFAREMAEAV